MAHEGYMREVDISTVFGFMRRRGVYGADGIGFGSMRESVDVSETFGFMKGRGLYGTNGVAMGDMRDEDWFEGQLGFMGVSKPTGVSTQVYAGGMVSLVPTGVAPRPTDDMREVTFDVVKGYLPEVKLISLFGVSE